MTIMKLRKPFLTLAAALSLAALLPAPTQASTGVLFITGSMQTTGTWAAASPFCGSIPCPSAGLWQFTSGLGGGVHPVVIGLTPPGYVHGDGQYIGWCEHATGTGVLWTGGERDDITWLLDAGNLTIVGSGAHTAVHGEFQVRPIVGNCITAAATEFLVVGTLELVQ